MTILRLAAPPEPPAMDQASADDAIEAFFRSGEAQKLIRFAYLLVGQREVAEDLVAEALARVLPKWRGGQIENPPGYLHRTMVNLAKRRSWRRRTELKEIERLAREHRSEHDVLLDTDVTEREAMWHALRVLPPKLRAVIVLRYYGDQSEDQIAEVLGIACGTVKSRAARAITLLRTRLEDEVAQERLRDG